MCVTIRRVKRFSWAQILTLLGLLLIVLSLVAFVSGLWIGTLTADFRLPLAGQGPLPVLDEAWVLVADGFYGEMPPASTRNRAAIRGLLETLQDPYTVLLDPGPAQQEQQRLSGRHGSIGASLWWAEQNVIALTPYTEGPAAAAGIRTGDRLMAIDGARLNGDISLEAVAAQLDGDIGSAVTLTLLRESESAEFTLTLSRAEVLQPSVEWRMLEDTNAIGYLQIRMFTVQTPVEVPQAVDGLLQQGARAMVLDLRGNGGGMLADLDAIAGVFLPSGLTLYYDVSESEEREIQVSGVQRFTGPLVVLVDHATASTAEVLAAAFRDHNRALLIGTQTYGKSSIQALYPLKDGSLLHVTHAVWLTPARNRLDGVGVSPDTVVEPNHGVDQALKTAIEHLTTGE